MTSTKSHDSVQFDQYRFTTRQPRNTYRFLRLSLVFIERSLIDHTGLDENSATEGRLAGIDVTNEDDVDVLLSIHLLQGILVDIRGLRLLDCSGIAS